MKRIINLGKVAYENDAKKNEVTIEIEVRDKPKGKELLIRGNVWNKNHSDIVAGGQCYDTIEDLFPGNKRVKRIVEIWKRWHLNDMRPGCEHQRDWQTEESLEIPEYTCTDDFYDRRKEAERGTLPVDAYEQYRLDEGIVNAICFTAGKGPSINPEEGLKRGLVKISKYKTKLAGWTYETEHPKGLLCKPCPVCGYKYGSAWLFEAIPQEILTELETI